MPQVFGGRDMEASARGEHADGSGWQAVRTTRMVRPASAIRPFGPAAFALQGFFRSLPAGRRWGQDNLQKKLSHKSGVHRVAAARRGKAILQFFRPPPTAADFDGRATEGLRQPARNAHRWPRHARQTLFYGHLRVSIPKTRMITKRCCLFEAAPPIRPTRRKRRASIAFESAKER